MAKKDSLTEHLKKLILVLIPLKGIRKQLLAENVLAGNDTFVIDADRWR